MNLIWNTAAAVIVSLGGGGAIVWFLVKWYSGILADKLSKQYAHRLSEELEKYKAELGKKVYIGNQRFDLAFSIYRELASALVNMTETSYFLFPPGDYLPEDKEEMRKMIIRRYEDAVKAYENASKIIIKNAAFIDRPLYEQCVQIRSVCADQLTSAKIFRIDDDSNKNRQAMYQDFRNTWKQSENILKLRDSFMEALRMYLQSLEEIQK